MTLVEDKVWKRRSLKGYYGFVDVGYVAYARDMEHATELKTKIEALVCPVEGDANLGVCGIVEEELSQRDHRARRVPGVGD